MEGGGVSGGEEVASAKDGERELSEVREAARGLQWGILGGVMCVCVCVGMGTSIHSYQAVDIVMWL